RRGRTALSCLGGINAKADPGDTRCQILVEVSFERSVEVEFGDYRIIGFGFAQANEAVTCMKIATLIWKVDLRVLTEKETDEIRTVGNQHVAAGYLLVNEEDVEHQDLVVNPALIGNVDRDWIMPQL